jgi:hypothetical protein
MDSFINGKEIGDGFACPPPGLDRTNQIAG